MPPRPFLGFIDQPALPLRPYRYVQPSKKQAKISADAAFHVLGKQLRLAAFNGDLEVVIKLIDNGADVNYARKRGKTTVLSYAAAKCHLPVVKALISRGADINKYSGQALIYAVRGATELDILCVSALIEAKANVNLCSSRFAGALQEAVLSDFPDCILHLHNAGADLEVCTDDGTTALMSAAFLGRFQCFKVLHSCGARLDATDNHDRSIAYRLEADFSRCDAEDVPGIPGGRALIQAYLQGLPAADVTVATLAAVS